MKNSTTKDKMHQYEKMVPFNLDSDHPKLMGEFVKDLVEMYEDKKMHLQTGTRYTKRSNFK